METPIYKERPSQVGKIMAAAKGSVFTENDAKKLLEFEQREAGTFLSKAGKPLPLTDEMKQQKEQLIIKKNTPPELGATGKKRVYSQWLQDKFNFNREFWSKQTDKGNEQEPESIKLAAKVAALFGIEKNEEKYENDFFKGTPDIVTNDIVIDVKTSWDAETFPMFEDEIPDKDYIYQVLAYLDLTGRRVGYVAYCLTSATEEMIQDEIRRECWRRKVIDPTEEQIEEIEDAVRWTMEFEQFPDNLRVKFFKVEYCEETVAKMKKRVEMARAYYSELEEKAAEMMKGPKL